MVVASKIAFAAVFAALVGQSIALKTKEGWTLATPGGPEDIVISADNTLNSTNPLNLVGGPSSNNNVRNYVGGGAAKRQAGPHLGIDLVNNFGGNVFAYITGTDPNNAFAFVGPNGQFYYPKPDGSGSHTPVDNGAVAIKLNSRGAQPLRITLPDYIISGRLWFSANDALSFFVNGNANAAQLVQPDVANPSDPSAGVFWGFAEFTNTAAGGLFLNPSQVDFVGLPVGIRIANPNGGQALDTPGLKANAITPICNSLRSQSAADGQPWGSMCMVDASGKLLRALSGTKYRAVNPTAFNGYYDNYVNEVFAKYSSGSTLSIVNAQTSSGTSTCTVVNGAFSCSEDEITYGRPNIDDIFGCASGPFSNTGSNVHLANLARLCAAFVRSTLLLGDGDSTPTQPSDQFYTVSPTNYYSKFVHANTATGTGYCFPYDDVHADGQPDQSGTLALNPPGVVTITIGGPTS